MQFFWNFVLMNQNWFNWVNLKRVWGEISELFYSVLFICTVIRLHPFESNIFIFTGVRTRKVSKANKTSSFQVNGNLQRPSSHYIAISPSINVFWNPNIWLIKLSLLWKSSLSVCNSHIFTENKKLKADLEAVYLSTEAEKKEATILGLSLKQKDAEIDRLKELTR